MATVVSTAASGTAASGTAASGTAASGMAASGMAASDMAAEATTNDPPCGPDDQGEALKPASRRPARLYCGGLGLCRLLEIFDHDDRDNDKMG